MTDNFALLDEPRRPWLDPETVKEKFLSLSSTVHPDRVHGLTPAERSAAQARYVELNAAAQCLRNPKDRLRHLLELELGQVPREIQRIPSDLMDVSLKVGDACRQTDVLIAEKAGITSPLLKVQFFERSQARTENLQALQQTLGARRDSLIDELRKLDARWTSEISNASPGRGDLFVRLEELYRLFSYYDRWNEQIQERIVQLSFQF